MEQSGPNEKNGNEWTEQDHRGPNWTEVDRMTKVNIKGPIWSEQDQSGQNDLNKIEVD